MPHDPETDRAAFGYTAALAHDGDLLNNKHNRVQDIFGPPAVVQDAKVTLLTPKGSDPFRPDYGLDVFRAVGTSDEQLKAAIRDAIESMDDDRIRRINRIEVTRPGDERDDTRVRIDLQLINDESVEFAFSPDAVGSTSH